MRRRIIPLISTVEVAFFEGQTAIDQWPVEDNDCLEWF
jgi:hypothetical protein